jgi:hypothetical protein
MDIRIFNIVLSVGVRSISCLIFLQTAKRFAPAEKNMHWLSSNILPTSQSDKKDRAKRRSKA